MIVGFILGFLTAVVIAFALLAQLVPSKKDWEAQNRAEPH